MCAKCRRGLRDERSDEGDLRKGKTSDEGISRLSGAGKDVLRKVVSKIDTKCLNSQYS
jgi:hypothetical protein